jgi:hypothetical protein
VNDDDENDGTNYTLTYHIMVKYLCTYYDNFIIITYFHLKLLCMIDSVYCAKLESLSGFIFQINKERSYLHNRVKLQTEKLMVMCKHESTRVQYKSNLMFE